MTTTPANDSAAAVIAALREAYANSTQAEWHGCHDGNCVCGTISSYEHDFMIARTELNHFEDAPQNVPMEVYTANAKFIFLAHNALPAILDRLERVEAENAALRAFVGIPDGVTVASVEEIMALPCTFGLPIETLLKAAARSTNPVITIKDAETKNPPTANG